MKRIAALTGTLALALWLGSCTDSPTETGLSPTLDLNGPSYSIDEIQSVVANPGGPYSADEGQRIRFDGTGSLDPDGDFRTFLWDFGDGGMMFPPGRPRPFHVYADNGDYTVTLTVGDGNGETAEATTTAHILNVPPNCGPIAAYPIPINTEGQIRGEFMDPGFGDTHTAEWIWESGGLAEDGDVTEENGSGHVENSHSYPAEGTYQIQLTVTDDDGGACTAQSEVLVIGEKLQKASIEISDVTITDADKYNGSASGRFTIMNTTDGEFTHVILGGVWIEFRADGEKGLKEDFHGPCMMGPGPAGYALAPHEAAQFEFHCSDLSPISGTLALQDAKKLKAFVYVNGATNQIGEHRDQLWKGPSPQFTLPSLGIVFHSTRDGDFDIYLLGESGEVQITNDPANDRMPSWSPDGAKIVFASDRGRPGGQYNLYVMNSDGTNVEQLTFYDSPDEIAWKPAWSPQGSWIAFQKGPDEIGDVFKVEYPLSGAGPVPVADSEDLEIDPTWNPFPGGQVTLAKAVKTGENTRDRFHIVSISPIGEEFIHTTDPFVDQVSPTWSWAPGQPNTLLYSQGGLLHAKENESFTATDWTLGWGDENGGVEKGFDFSADGLRILVTVRGGDDQGIWLIPGRFNDPGNKGSFKLIDAGGWGRFKPVIQ